jgi:type IVB pilus formation R64 PilN family outer membrane protein
MSILPHVLTNGTVMLQFGTDISALRSIRTVTSGSAENRTSIETPEVDTRNFLQRVAMKSGDTLVISGFEQTDANLTRKGIGNASFFGLGGGLSATRDKEVIVILVTPMALGGA